MNRTSSRYFNTAKKMDEALISLLDKKDFEYITIKEICEAAGVNRSTFYLHYENTADLLNETTEYILDKHFSYYSADTKNIKDCFADCGPKDLVFITSEHLIPYLTFVKENKRIFKVSIKQFHSLNMNDVYNKMFRFIFDPILSRFHVPKSERAYIIKFYLNGIFGIVMEWLNNNCSDEIDSISKIIIDCVLGERTLND